MTCLQCEREIPDVDAPFALKRGTAGFICTWCRGTRLAIPGVRLGRCLEDGRAGSAFEGVRDSGELCRIRLVRSFGPIRSELLEAEARRIAALRKPGVLRLLGFGVAGDFVWWAEEASAARSLARLLGSKLEPRWSARFVAQLAETLAPLGARLAQSFAPEQVLVDEVRGPLVSAFAAADFIQREGENWARTGDRGSFGDLPYMPPEQIEDAARIDERIGVYRLGAYLHHMLSGEKPFHATTNMDFFMKILNEPPPPIDRPDVPASLRDVLSRGLAKKAADRFASLKELAAALRAAVGER